MLLWIGFAVMTAAVVAALARPLGRQGEASLDSRAADLAVYKDQLDEIESERSSGLIGEAEAEAARTEVARRMLARADQDHDKPAQDKPASAVRRARDGKAPQRLASFSGPWISVAAVPLLAALVYIAYGSPWLPGQPHASRSVAGRAQIADLVAKVEKRLKEHPEDGQGWDVLAPVYRRFERYPEAADAYRRAIQMLGPEPKRLWGLAESLIASNNGLVTAEAREALEKIVPADPSNIGARYWLAAAKEQDGKRDAAVADYTSLLPDLPADTAWRKAIEERLAALGVEIPAKSAPGGSVTAAKGPSVADMAAAEKMAPEDRAAMVEKMVAGLAERLKSDTRDLTGWQKLIRAYKVLGRDAEARQALGAARGAFKGDAKAESELDAFAASLGLGG